MPFIAKHIKTGKLVAMDSDQTLHQVRLNYQKGDFCCPECGRTLFPRGGKRLAHWFHQARRDDSVNCPLLGKRESLLHMTAKRDVKHWLEERYQDDQKEVSIVYEHRFASAGSHGRIADVAVLYPSGWHRAIEIQVSDIEQEDLRKRTEDYTNAGIDVTWFFGRDVYTKEHVADFAAKYLSEVCLLDWSEREENWEVISRPESA